MIDCWYGFKLFMSILGIVTVAYVVSLATTVEIDMHEYNFMESPGFFPLLIAYGWFLVLVLIIITVFMLIIYVITWTCGAFINLCKSVVISTKNKPEKEHTK